MRWLKLGRRIDPGLGVAVVLCLLAVWPFLRRPDLPHHTDAELHIYRLAELSRLVQGGQFYPRWAPNFYYGYGYPIFNYYAPLTYYVSLLWLLLPGVTVAAAAKITLCLGLIGAGLSMYALVRDGWGRVAGWIAAALYVYAPYVQFIDPQARGVLPESLSFAVFPLALWALARLQRRPSPGRWLAAVGLIAAVILVHNLMAMVFGALLGAWWLWQVVVVPRSAEDGPWWAGGLALALGVGLAAFFWLPLILERHAVTLHNLVGGGHYDYRSHFLTLADWLAPSLRLDWGATEPAYRFNLGLAQWILGAAGLALGLTWRHAGRRQLLFWVVAAGFLLFLTLPLSTPLWQLTPLLPYLQFPWRLLGPIAAALAIVGGVGVARLAQWRDRPVGRWLPPLAIAAIWSLALPLSQPPPWGPFGPTTALAVMQIELEGRWLGTTSTADFVPATVVTIPRVQDAVLADYLAGRPPERLNRATLPADAQITTEIVNPLRTRYHVTTSEPFLLRLFLFDFPGWTARIDGAPVPIEVAEPEGFITVWTPAGTHTVEVAFESTPARRWGWGVSALSLTLALAGAWGWRRAQFPAPGDDMAWRQAGLILGITLGLLAGLAFFLEPRGLLHWNSAAYRPQPAQVAAAVNFGQVIALTGYDPPPTTLRAGERLDLTLYWQALQPMTDNYQAFVHVLRPDGTILTQADKLNPGDFPTERWPLDKYVRDAYTLTIPADAPPGDYRLTVGLWLWQAGQRLPATDVTGHVLGDVYVIQTVTVP